MRFSHYLIAGTQVWAASQGEYTFLILKSRDTGFVCSYKIHINLDKLAIFFKGDQEFEPKSMQDNAPDGFDVPLLEEAKEACKRKYRELLLR